MKNILFAADYVYIGGGEVALLDLMAAAKRLEIHPILLIPHPGLLLDEAKNRSIDVKIIDMPPAGKPMARYPLRFARSLWRIMRLIKKEGIEYIFANNLNIGIYTALAAKPFGIKTAWYCWSDDFPKDRFWQKAYRFLFHKIIFCSHFVKERMRPTAFKEEDIPVIYPGIDIERLSGDDAHLEDLFRKENNIPRDCAIFSIIGRLDQCKNHLMFIGTADQIANRIPRSRFVIAGGYTEVEGADTRVRSELNERIKDLPGLAGRIIFTGFVKDINKIIRSSRIIFSCTGDRDGGESFGLTLVEAMLSGRPVIAIAAGGPREIIRDGFNGFLVKPGDYNSMAEKAIELVNSEATYNNIVYNARQYAIERYSIERFAKKVLDI